MYVFRYLFSLRVTTSIYPVPSICAQDQISDWFDSLAECLHWNARKSQKAFDDFDKVSEKLDNTHLTWYYNCWNKWIK